jgi:hypothetical protein
MRFTSANAREMSARGNATRWSRYRMAKEAPANHPATTMAIPEPAGDTGPGIDVTRVRARLETLDRLMSKANSDREWDNYSRAFDRLFKVLCVLTKTPGPGNYKSVPLPRRPNYARPLEPLPLVPTSPPKVSAVVDEDEEVPRLLYGEPPDEGEWLQRVSDDDTADDASPAPSRGPTAAAQLPAVADQKSVGRAPAASPVTFRPSPPNDSPLIQHTPAPPRMTYKDGKLGYHGNR